VATLTCLIVRVEALLSRAQPDREDRVISIDVLVLAVLGGLLGGTMNAMAGGGTFVTLPVLVAFGLPSNVANATSNFSLLPGACSSAWVYRDEQRPLGGLDVRPFALITFVGGLVGGILLVVTPTRAFDLLIPRLLLLTLVVMLFGARASAFL
jgi:uncharacterized membrane protein YfcA